VGDGWWRDRLTRRIERMGMTDRVIMTGLVAADDVPRCLRAMDVLVHPSYREGLPRTLPQALLSGVPVVAYDRDGAPEACIDGRTGRLVATGDRGQLLDALAWMADHPAERQAMATAGRTMCVERFDAAVMVSQLEGLYRQLL
jgi:glycosyltransferase involved in cell wall biosynthesis